MHASDISIRGKIMKLCSLRPLAAVVFGVGVLTGCARDVSGPDMTAGSTARDSAVKADEDLPDCDLPRDQWKRTADGGWACACRNPDTAQAIMAITRLAGFR